MAAEKVVPSASPLEWKSISESSVLYRSFVEVDAAQVGQVTLYVNSNFLRHWLYALSFHDEVVYEVHISPPPNGHGNPPGRPKPRFPRRVTSAEHEHIWIEGLETRCALPLDGFEQATHCEMLDEFCKRARIDFRPEYRDPVKGVQLQI